MKIFSNKLSKTEEIKHYVDFSKEENCIKQKNFLAKIFLELKYRMLEIIDFFPDAIIIINKK